MWKRLVALPDEFDDLEKRVAALEKQLGDTWPADVCEHCGKRALLRSTRNREIWTCGECRETTFRPLKG